MNEDNLFIIACMLAAPVVGFLFIAAWVKKKTCVTGTDFIVEQGNFLRGLWTISHDRILLFAHRLCVELARLDVGAVSFWHRGPCDCMAT